MVATFHGGLVGVLTLGPALPPGTNPSILDAMPHPPEHKLRWYQYSLRSLFILTTLVALACSWYATVMHNAAKRRAAIAEIEKLQGQVKYYGDPFFDGTFVGTFVPDWGKPPRWFSWLRKLHGDEHLGNAVYVGFLGTDAGLVHLKDLTDLEQLELSHTQITDAGLVHLKGLTKLEGLGLDNTQITDAGLALLKGLPNLNVLDLDRTKITGAGLVHLQGLTNLEALFLSGSQITDSGLAHLDGLTNLKRLDLNYTQISDAGLVHLRGLTQLEGLLLDGTQVTDEAVKNLQQALPNCEIACFMDHHYPGGSITPPF